MVGGLASSRLRRPSQIISEFQNFLLTAGPNQPYSDLVPPPYEGRFAIVTDVRRDAVDADALIDERRVIPPSLKLRRAGTKPVEAFGVDGCGRRRRVVLTPRRWRQVRAKERGRRWQESPVAGESTI